MKNPNQRLVRKRFARGVTLIEVLIVIAIMSLLSAVAAVAVVSVWRTSQKDTARLNASSLRHTAGVWRLSHPAEECPTAAQLRADKVLDKSSNLVDPWGSPYTISCADDDITVISPGPDKKIGTEDDIVAPPDAKVAREP
jgi:general secretion pathway protein G